MKERPFRLHRFPTPGPVVDVSIEGTAARVGDGLELRFRLSGDLDRLVLPQGRDAGARRDGLWRDTCFECFVATPGSTAYLEIHLSPALDWNVYRFDDTRRGGRPEPAVTDLVRSVEVRDGELIAAFGVPWAVLDPAAGRLELGVAAVVRDDAGGLAYWALTHPADRPDFHRREGFLLRL